MLIQNPKTYKGQELETIFFRPTFCGPKADEFGVRIIYNMPMPTTVQVWSHKGNLLQPFQAGWSNAGPASNKLQKRIDMQKVKAENAFSAEDYFSMVFEQITNSADVNLGDLTGTELEKAETELFRRSIAESVRATMWVGDTEGSLSQLTSFDGFIKHLGDICLEGKSGIVQEDVSSKIANGSAIRYLRHAWDNASEELRGLRSEGNLVFYVTPDIYNDYELWLDDKGGTTAYSELKDGRQTLCYHGIPIVEVPVSKYLNQMSNSFCVLTDKRNFVLALNTAELPENEVRMWYNPDEMENRQRTVFLAGTAIIDENLVSGTLIDTLGDSEGEENEEV